MRTELDPEFSEETAQPIDWSVADKVLTEAETSWLATVRPTGRPHVTPLITVWLDGAIHFTAGPRERKTRNLRENSKVVVTTGNNTLSDGLDVVVEGDAIRTTDQDTLRRIAEAYLGKYGETWRFSVGDGVLIDPSGRNDGWVFAVTPRVAFAFGKDPYSQTRYEFREQS